MSDYIVTQQDVEILLQPSKTITYKLEILNADMKLLDTIEGNLISDNLSIDAESNARRSYSCELIVSNSSFLIQENSYIWYNKLIRPYIGIFHQRSQTIKYYCLGTFLYTDMSYNFDASTNTLSLSCKDMMCLLDDTRNGNLDEYKRKMYKDADVRQAIIDLLKEVGITKYYIEFNINGKYTSTYSLPYDKTFEIDSTVYDILSYLVYELYPGNQMYFDQDGIFNIRKISVLNNDAPILTDDILSQIVINENVSTSFTNIYNKIIVFGRVQEPDFFSTTVVWNGSCYNVTIEEDTSDEDQTNWIKYDQYTNSDVIAIKILNTNSDNSKININGLGEVPIVDEDGNPIRANTLINNDINIFRYRLYGDNFIPQFVYLGQYQARGEAVLDNISHPLSVQKIGTIQKILSGGEYDNIFTNSLATDRAKYELYNALNRAEPLNLTTIIIPWLDVNTKISYTPKSTNQTFEYIVKNISWNSSDFTMSIALSKFYPEYI